MDLEHGGTIYVEAGVNRSLILTVEHGMARMYISLTTEEARTMASALIAASIEAEAQRG